MFGKLLKYEMKSTSRVMWFLYAAVVIVGAIIGVVLRFSSNSGDLDLERYSFIGALVGLPQIIFIIFIIIYVLLLLALAIMTAIMIILRFHNNLLKGEGYLMHTLPVPTWMLVLSKTVISIIWMAIGAAASIVSALLLGLTSGMLPYIIKEDGLKQFWSDITELFGGNSALYIAVVAVSCIMLILQFYFSMAVGNIANHYKFLLAVGVFIAVQIVVAIITGAISSAASSLSADQEIYNITGAIRSTVNGMMIRELIVNAAFAAAFFFGTTAILKKRLNLA